MNAAVKTAPFDLEAAKRGEAICQNDGTLMRFVAIIDEDHDYPVWCVSRQGVHQSFTLAGKFFTEEDSIEGESTESEDLCMVVKTKTVWVNLYCNGIIINTFGNSYATEAEAQCAAAKGVLRTVSVEVPV